MELFRRVLAIETSCDDTSVAVVEGDGFVRSVLSAHQNKSHEVFGGIVPEIASRNHTHHLLPLVERCLSQAGLTLKDIDGFAVTSRPGLIGSLLVGVVTVKSLSLAMGRPFIGINHLEGHLLAPFLKDQDYAPPQDFQYPFIALAISGGHTSLYRIDGLGQYSVLGQTIDDAAGEAFDKFGKMLGLGFPGGVRVDHQSKNGKVDQFNFPRPLLREDHLNFSFSGMKTAAQKILDNLSADERIILADQAKAALTAGGPAESAAQLPAQVPSQSPSQWSSQSTSKSKSKSASKSKSEVDLLADLCASFQEAMVDVLLDRMDRAVRAHGISRAVLTGGVSANSRLRERATKWAQQRGVQIVVPPIRYCTDNAAMIGYAGIQRLNSGERSSQSLGPEPRAPLGAAPLPKNLPKWLVKAKT
jgi:N6-L-threonylcarbamoyladenine synthase